MARRGPARRVLTPEGEEDRRIVDRLLQDLPFADLPTPRPPPLRRRAVPGARVYRSPNGGPAGKAGTWIRLAIGLLYGASILQWPYGQACGAPLTAYFLAVSAVVVTGVWVGIRSWKRRQPLAQLIAIGLVGWGIILGTDQVLQRTDYTKTQMTWTCPAS